MNRGRNRFIHFAIAMCALIAVAELFVIGCNGILGNAGGILEQQDGSASASCTADQKLCASTCVSISDPQVGCGGACSVCQPPVNAQSTCVLENDVQTCALGICNDQFGDCDNDAGDGCETHTTTVTHCGSCGTQCNQEPYCEPSGKGTYICSNTCDFQVCPNGTDAGACVDFRTDVDNCGACGKSCEIANGSGTCEDGGCAVTCGPGFFSCSGNCTGVSPASCGASCAPCPGTNVCDTISGSPTYGTCIIPISPDSGGGSCTTSADCSSGNVCCNGQCFAQDATHCGSKCTNCSDVGYGETCSNGSCTISCSSEPYNCGSSPNCGCVVGASFCNTTPDFSTDTTCGDCTTNCTLMLNTCCCGPVGGSNPDGGFSPMYTCSGTKNGDVGCTCAI